MLKWLVGQVSVFVFERARRNIAGSLQIEAKYSGWRIVQSSRTSLEVGGKARCWNIGILQQWNAGHK
jgi:hypothetical protein